jgi:hypothetical protein
MCYGMRVLRSNPGFAVVALLTLALARRLRSAWRSRDRKRTTSRRKRRGECRTARQKAEVFFKESGSDGKRAAVSIVEKDGEREKDDDAGQFRW